MKKTYLIMIIIFFVLTNTLISKDTDKDNSLDFDIGLVFKAGSAEIVFNNSELKNDLAFIITALRVDFDISNYIKLGIIAGYQQNHFNDSINAVNLPLSLGFSEDNSNSMLFGFIIESEPFSIDDFVLDINFEFNYYKSFLKSWKIELPIAIGTAESNNSFYKATLSFLFKYEGFANFTPYIGPNLSLISGKLSLSENIMEIEAEEIMKYSQKNLIGLSAGVKFEVGDNWDIGLKLNLFSEKSIYLSAFYIF